MGKVVMLLWNKSEGERSGFFQAAVSIPELEGRGLGYASFHSAEGAEAKEEDCRPGAWHTREQDVDLWGEPTATVEFDLNVAPIAAALQLLHQEDEKKRLSWHPAQQLAKYKGHDITLLNSMTLVFWLIQTGRIQEQLDSASLELDPSVSGSPSGAIRGALFGYRDQSPELVTLCLIVEEINVHLTPDLLLRAFYVPKKYEFNPFSTVFSAKYQSKNHSFRERLSHTFEVFAGNSWLVKQKTYRAGLWDLLLIRMFFSGPVIFFSDLARKNKNNLYYCLAAPFYLVSGLVHAGQYLASAACTVAVSPIVLIVHCYKKSYPGQPCSCVGSDEQPLASGEIRPKCNDERHCLLHNNGVAALSPAHATASSDPRGGSVYQRKTR